MDDSTISSQENKPYKQIFKLLIVLVVGALIGGSSVWFFFTEQDAKEEKSTITSFDECIGAGFPAMESYPRQCSTDDGESFIEQLTGAVQYNSEKGVFMEINDFQDDEKISSPLTVTGRVPGNWSFEADFPVALTNWDGLIIAEEPAMLSGDWMTEELVPFEVTLEFDKPELKDNGWLILRKDNPSGLPENDDFLEIPVVFE